MQTLNASEMGRLRAMNNRLREWPRPEWLTKGVGGDQENLEALAPYLAHAKGPRRKFRLHISQRWTLGIDIKR